MNTEEGQIITEENKEEKKDILQSNPEQVSTDNNQKSTPYTTEELSVSPNQRISFKRGKKKPYNEKKEEDIYEDNIYNKEGKNSLSNNIYKAKSRQIEENKEISEFNDNKKLRNTISSLSNDKMKYESGLINMILRIEKDNVNHYLGEELAEMYKDINRNNHFLKHDVFLANVDNFEKKTGDLDKQPIIPYNCSEDISFKLGTYPKTNDIIDKFAERSKTFQ